MSTLSRSPQSLLTDSPDEARLCRRIQAEFQEMPGLTLTLPQAARLFGLEAARCERVFGVLVDRGCLSTNGRSFASAPSRRRSA